MSDDEKPTRVRKKYIHARAIASSGESVLLEWFDGETPKRGYVPIVEFDREKSVASEDVLSAAIPYGIDWTRAKVKIDTELLNRELKRKGFWTVDDIRSNPQLVNIIIMRVAGLGRSALEQLKEANNE